MSPNLFPRNERLTRPVHITSSDDGSYPTVAFDLTGQERKGLSAGKLTHVRFMFLCVMVLNICKVSILILNLLAPVNNSQPTATTCVKVKVNCEHLNCTRQGLETSMEKSFA